MNLSSLVHACDVAARRVLSVTRVLGAMLVVLAAPSSRGQGCQEHWLSWDGAPGVDDSVEFLSPWDPDGDGPSDGDLPGERAARR